MSEGPEVRRQADKLAEILDGQTLVEFKAFPKRLVQWNAVLTGRMVESVSTHGKTIRIDVAGGLVLISHLMMWGHWQVYPPDTAIPYDRRIRVAMRTVRGLVLLFNGPVFDVLTQEQAASHRLMTLGPDALTTPFAAHQLLANLTAQPARQIGDALLDQRIVAGVGNYLKSEILWECRIDPFRLVGTLTASELAHLAQCIPDMVQRSYTRKGQMVELALIPPSDERAPSRSYIERFNVYARSGRPCRRCGTRIRSAQQGPQARRTFWCPNCQR